MSRPPYSLVYNRPRSRDLLLNNSLLELIYLKTHIVINESVNEQIIKAVLG